MPGVLGRAKKRLKCLLSSRTVPYKHMKSTTKKTGETTVEDVIRQINPTDNNNITTTTIEQPPKLLQQMDTITNKNKTNTSSRQSIKEILRDSPFNITNESIDTIKYKQSLNTRPTNQTYTTISIINEEYQSTFINSN